MAHETKGKEISSARDPRRPWEQIEQNECHERVTGTSLRHVQSHLPPSVHFCSWRKTLPLPPAGAGGELWGQEAFLIFLCAEPRLPAGPSTRQEVRPSSVTSLQLWTQVIIFSSSVSLRAPHSPGFLPPSRVLPRPPLCQLLCFFRPLNVEVIQFLVLISAHGERMYSPAIPMLLRANNPQIYVSILDHLLWNSRLFTTELQKVYRK